MHNPIVKPGPVVKSSEAWKALKIRLLAIDDIYKGEEIFIHYLIIANSFVPQWYQELYEAQIEAWPRSKKSSVNNKC